MGLCPLDQRETQALRICLSNLTFVITLARSITSSRASWMLVVYGVSLSWIKTIEMDGMEEER